MEKIWMNKWPENLPREIEFAHGSVPIHEYLRIRAEETPEKTAISFMEGGSVIKSWMNPRNGLPIT